MSEDDIIRFVDRRGNVHDREQIQQNAAQSRMIAASVVERLQLLSSTKYDLVASICHDTQMGSRTQSGVQLGDVSGVPSTTAVSTSAFKDRSSSETDGTSVRHGSAVPSTGPIRGVLSKGSFKIHVSSKVTGQWFEISDLRVVETSPQLIGVSEAYMLVYEKKKPSAAKSGDKV